MSVIWWALAFSGMALAGGFVFIVLLEVLEWAIDRWDHRYARRQARRRRRIRGEGFEETR